MSPQIDHFPDFTVRETDQSITVTKMPFMKTKEHSPSPASSGAQPVGLSSASLTLLTAVIWGGTTVAMSYGLESFEPVAMAAMRFAIGCLFLLLWCHWEHTPLSLEWRQLPIALSAGGILFVQIWSFNVGVQLSNSSHGVMLINTFVFWIVLIEHFVTKNDRLTTRKTVGLVLAAAGVFLILWLSDPPSTDTRRPDDPSLLGDVVLMASALLLGIKIVVIKHALRTMRPGKIIFWHNLFAVVLFSSYSLAFEPWSGSVSTPAILGILYQGILVAGFCFALHARLLQKHSASQLAVFSFATPLFGVVLASLLRNDPLPPWIILSAFAVAGGIFLVNKESSSMTKSIDTPVV